MRKILLWAAQIMMLLASLLVGFVNGTQLSILCISCLVCSLLLLLTWAIGQKHVWDLFFLGASVLFVHGYYLSVYTRWNLVLFLAMLMSMILALVFLFTRLGRPLQTSLSLESAMCAKAGLIPEILLNSLMSRFSDLPAFRYFSWFLLIYTSIFVFTAILQMYREQSLSKSWAIAGTLLQCFFFTDLIGTILLLILQGKGATKKKVQKDAPKVYQSASFNRKRARRILH